jgi:hypothetical protein
VLSQSLRTQTMTEDAGTQIMTEDSKINGGFDDLFNAAQPYGFQGELAYGSLGPVDETIISDGNRTLASSYLPTYLDSSWPGLSLCRSSSLHFQDTPGPARPNFDPEHFEVAVQQQAPWPMCFSAEGCPDVSNDTAEYLALRCYQGFPTTYYNGGTSNQPSACYAAFSLPTTPHCAYANNSHLALRADQDSGNFLTVYPSAHHHLNQESLDLHHWPANHTVPQQLAHRSGGATDVGRLPLPEDPSVYCQLTTNSVRFKSNIKLT